MDEKQIRSIVVFGDIIGFGSFMQRITNPDTEFRPFRREFDKAIKDFKKKTGYFVKRLGDGFMCVVELPVKGPDRQAMAAVDFAWTLSRRISRLIAHKSTPRPDGFRSRMICGYVWRTVGDDNDTDYLGYLVNLCEKMLHTHKGVEFVCHESVRELIGRLAKQRGYIFKKIFNMNAGTEEIYRQDLSLLWTITKRRR